MWFAAIADFVGSRRQAAAEAQAAVDWTPAVLGAAGAVFLLLIAER